MKKDVKKHADIKSTVMNTKKTERKIKQLVINNQSKRNNRKNEYTKKKSDHKIIKKTTKKTPHYFT